MYLSTKNVLLSIELDFFVVLAKRSYKLDIMQYEIYTITTSLKSGLIGEKMHVFIALKGEGYLVYPACSLFA